MPGLGIELKRRLLTLVHCRVTDHAMLLKVSAGWHMHLDVLAAYTNGHLAPPFWLGWTALTAEYARRLPPPPTSRPLLCGTACGSVLHQEPRRHRHH